MSLLTLMITNAITIIPSGGCATAGDDSCNSIKQTLITLISTVMKKIMKMLHKVASKKDACNLWIF